MLAIPTLCLSPTHDPSHGLQMTFVLLTSIGVLRYSDFACGVGSGRDVRSLVTIWMSEGEV